jgi:hypothetical protein
MSAKGASIVATRSPVRRLEQSYEIERRIDEAESAPIRNQREGRGADVSFGL